MNRIVMTLLLACTVFVSGPVAQLPTATILGQVKDANECRGCRRQNHCAQCRDQSNSNGGNQRRRHLPGGCPAGSATMKSRLKKSGLKTEIQSGFGSHGGPASRGEFYDTGWRDVANGRGDGRKPRSLVSTTTSTFSEVWWTVNVLSTFP